MFRYKIQKQIDQYRRFNSSDSGSHINKDMKGNSETKIRQWLYEQKDKATTPPKEVENAQKIPKNNQSMQNSDICTIL